MSNENGELLENKLLEKYISKYVLRDTPIEISNTRIYLYYGLRVASVLLGATAGIPWIQPGITAAEAMHIRSLQYPIAAGLLLAYGATSSWAFLQIVKALDPEPEEIKLIRSKQNKIKNLTKHSFTHLFGLLSSMAVFYIGIMYNTNIYFALLGGILAYVFNTMGIYELGENLKIIAIHTLTFFRLIQENPADKIRNKYLSILQYALDYYQAYPDLAAIKSLEISTAFAPNAYDEIASENQQFWNTLISLDKVYERSPPNNLVQFFCKIGLLVFFPAITALYRTLIIYPALRNKVHLDPYSAGLLTFLSLTPLYGIDIYAMNTIAGALAKKIHEKINRLAPIPDYMSNQHPYSFIPIYVIAFLLSGFSSIMNAYVAYDQMNQSILKSASILFLVSAWILSATFQTIGFSAVTQDLIKFADRKVNYNKARFFKSTERLESLSHVIRQCEDRLLPRDEVDAHEQPRLGI